MFILFFFEINYEENPENRLSTLILLTKPLLLICITFLPTYFNLFFSSSSCESFAICSKLKKLKIPSSESEVKIFKHYLTSLSLPIMA